MGPPPRRVKKRGIEGDRLVSAGSPGGAISAFPNWAETLALKASLLDGDAALAAWKELSDQGATEDGGIAWIRPLLAANIGRLRPHDPFVQQTPHYLTLCQLRERAIIQFAQRTLGLLEDASIRTLALKGLALGATVYPPGLRVVSDLDLLVPVDQAFQAFALLVKHRFRSGGGEPARPADLRDKHAHTFYSTRKHDLAIDLHWHVLASARGDRDDDFFWSEAVPLRVGKTETRRLCDEDQLMHVLVHGVRWTRSPHVRWVADAALILRQAGAGFRPERLLAAAREFGVVTPVREGLRFVSETIGEGTELWERLRSLEDSPLSERAFKARATAYEKRTVADRMAMRIENVLWAHRARHGRRKGVS